MAVAVGIILILRNKTRNCPPVHPISIESIASILTHQSTVADFCKIDPTSSKDELALAMHQRCYQISNCNDFSNRAATQSLISTPELHPPSHIDSNLGALEPRPAVSLLAHLPPHLAIIAPAFLTATLLIVILAYASDHSNDPFNNFFNSTAFGPKFLLTISATVLGISYR